MWIDCDIVIGSIYNIYNIKNNNSYSLADDSACPPSQCLVLGERLCSLSMLRSSSPASSSGSSWNPSLSKNACAITGSIFATEVVVNFVELDALAD